MCSCHSVVHDHAIMNACMFSVPTESTMASYVSKLWSRCNTDIICLRLTNEPRLALLPKSNCTLRASSLNTSSSFLLALSSCCNCSMATCSRSQRNSKHLSQVCCFAATFTVIALLSPWSLAAVYPAPPSQHHVVEAAPALCMKCVG